MLTFDKKSNPACYKHNEANCQALLTNEKRDAPKKRVISLSSTFFLYRNILVSCLFLQPLPADLTLLLKLLTKVFEPSRNWAIQPNLLLGPIEHSGQKPHFFKTFKKLVSMFENYSKCRIWILQFWHFPPIFVLLKLTCLVILFDCKLQIFKNSSKWTIVGIFNNFCPLKM